MKTLGPDARCWVINVLAPRPCAVYWLSVVFLCVGVIVEFLKLAAACVLAQAHVAQLPVALAGARAIDTKVARLVLFMRQVNQTKLRRANPTI